MKGRYSKESSGQMSGMQQQFDEKNLKKMADEYKCGKNDCGKFYHSYTAFYNHCKKSHGGQLPQDSLHNGKIFEGPSKNRGRPRIKKIDVKDSVQIESLKTENELIQFLGTLTTKKKKAQEVIVYVEDPIEQLDEALNIASQWSQSFNQFFEKLKHFNAIVTKNDLPEFYDPIEIRNYTDNLDSYNFTSIFTFFMNPAKFEFHQNQEEGASLLQKILVAWLSRILSSKLLAQVVYTLAQINANIQKVTEKEYFLNKSGKFKNLMEKYFQCLQTEYPNKDE